MPDSETLAVPLRPLDHDVPSVAPVTPLRLGRVDRAVAVLTRRVPHEDSRTSLPRGRGRDAEPTVGRTGSRGGIDRRGGRGGVDLEERERSRWRERDAVEGRVRVRAREVVVRRPSRERLTGTDEWRDRQLALWCRANEGTVLEEEESGPRDEQHDRDRRDDDRSEEERGRDHLGIVVVTAIAERVND